MAVKRKPKVVDPGRGAFRSRASANRYVEKAFEDFRKDYRKHKLLLERRLAEVGAQLKAGEGPTTALIEQETSIMAQMKALRINHNHHLMSFVKEKGLLEGLDKTERGDGLTIIIQLPDFSQVTVVHPDGPPGDD